MMIGQIVSTGLQMLKGEISKYMYIITLKIENTKLSKSCQYNIANHNNRNIETRNLDTGQFIDRHNRRRS